MIDKYQAYQPTKWERRIDALFGLVSTRAALNRMVNRERMNWFRYLSAQPTSARRNTPSTVAGEWLKVQREKLQTMWNAIMMVDNSGLCSGILIKFPTYICGTLGWQARTGDKGVNDQYQQYIKHKTCKPGNIDITRRYTLRQMCMLDIKSIVLKGDVGTNIVREDDEIYLQGIEADRIGDPYKWDTSEGYVRGLELDDVGAINAVRVYRQDRRTGFYKYEDTFPTKDKRGLPNFLFFANPIDFDNYRGVSLFKHAIDNSTYIDRMRQYELQALLWASSQSGVYYTKSGGLPEDLPFSNQPMVDESGNMINTYQVRPNTISALSSEGESVQMFQHDRPSPNVIGMYENTVRDIAIGAGLTYGFTYSMMGLTGPAVRQSSAQDSRAIQIWQEMLREQKLDPIIMLLLGDAISKGDLPYHKNWLMWDWFFPAKPTIDVGRESAANIEELQSGLNTGANIAAESGLGDIRDVITQRGHEVEMQIETAQEIADRLGMPWQQVYQMMIPPRGKGGGGGPGGVGGAPSFGGGFGGGMGGGATDGGVELDGEEREQAMQTLALALGNGEREQIVVKKNDKILTLAFDGIEYEFWNPQQIRDEGGKFEDEGKGSEEPGYQHPGVADLKGLDKRLVDYRMERPLSRGAKHVKSIGDYIPGMHYVNYSKTPFFDQLNKLQGTPDPDGMKIEDYAKARSKLFSMQTQRKLPINNKLIATQPVVNGKKVNRNIDKNHIKPISVVQYGDKMFVVDGHHALMAAAKRGDKDIRARVLHLQEDSSKKQKFVFVPDGKIVRWLDAESGKTQDRDEHGRYAPEDGIKALPAHIARTAEIHPGHPVKPGVIGPPPPKPPRARKVKQPPQQPIVPAGRPTAEKIHPGAPVKPMVVGKAPEKPPGTYSEILRTGEASDIKRTDGGHANGAYFVTFKAGGKGVFKPANEEKHDLRPGRVDGNFYGREAAAYDIAKKIGLDDLVPETIVRKIPGKGIGSMQEFVPGNDAHMLPESERYDGTNDLARSAAYDFAIFNTDRHPGNWRITPNGKIRLTDNGLAFPKRQEDFRSYLFDEADHDRLDIPDEAKHWKDHWPEIENILKAREIEQPAIDQMHRRIDRLAIASDFHDLMHGKGGPQQTFFPTIPTKPPPSLVKPQRVSEAIAAAKTPGERPIGAMLKPVEAHPALNKPLPEAAAGKIWDREHLKAEGMLPTPMDDAAFSNIYHASEYVDRGGRLRKRDFVDGFNDPHERDRQAADMKAFDEWMMDEQGRQAVKKDNDWEYEKLGAAKAGTMRPSTPKVVQAGGRLVHASEYVDRHDDVRKRMKAGTVKSAGYADDVNAHDEKLEKEKGLRVKWTPEKGYEYTRA